MITLNDLRKVYPTRGGAEVVALDGIDLHVERGSIHGIVGESGAGKSTLIRCLTALERPTSGTVAVDGHELGTLGERALRSQRRRIGMVFQHVNLLESRTAAANVAYPLRVAGMPRAERVRRVAELLEIVGLAGRGDAYPAQLSGGQKQRVGIARALATEPAVLLCDEPTSALDSATTRQILALIRDVRDRLGITVLIITHEMAVVREVCDTVTLLAAGRVAQHGPIGQVVADHGSRLSRALISLPPHRPEDGRVLVEVAFVSPGHTGEGMPGATHAGATHAGSGSAGVTTAHVLDALAHLGADVEVSAGTIETLAGERVGRLQLSIPVDRRADVLTALHSAGLHAEVTS